MFLAIWPMTFGIHFTFLSLVKYHVISILLQFYPTLYSHITATIFLLMFSLIIICHRSIIWHAWMEKQPGGQPCILHYCKCMGDLLETFCLLQACNLLGPSFPYMYVMLDFIIQSHCYRKEYSLTGSSIWSYWLSSSFCCLLSRVRRLQLQINMNTGYCPMVGIVWITKQKQNGKNLEIVVGLITRQEA